MTTISSNTAALSSLVTLYAGENGSASGKSATLTTDQIGSIETMIEGPSSGSTGLEALLGTPATGTDDMSSIIDAISAQATAAAPSSASTTGTTAPASTQQQKAAALMQSVYQSQQANLFTLLG